MPRPLITTEDIGGIAYAISCYSILNLSSALDTLDHNILSIRLNEIGIHGQVSSWFMYFFSSRTSSVKINPRYLFLK